MYETVEGPAGPLCQRELNISIRFKILSGKTESEDFEHLWEIVRRGIEKEIGDGGLDEHDLFIRSYRIDKEEVVVESAKDSESVTYSICPA